MIGLTVLASLNVLSVAVFLYTLRKTQAQLKAANKQNNWLYEELQNERSVSNDAIDDNTKQVDAVQDEVTLTNLAVKDLLAQVESLQIGQEMMIDLTKNNEELVNHAIDNQNLTNARLEVLLEIVSDPRSPELSPDVVIGQGSLTTTISEQPKQDSDLFDTLNYTMAVSVPKKKSKKSKAKKAAKKAK